MQPICNGADETSVSATWFQNFIIRSGFRTSPRESLRGRGAAKFKGLAVQVEQLGLGPREAFLQRLEPLRLLERGQGGQRPRDDHVHRAGVADFLRDLLGVDDDRGREGLREARLEIRNRLLESARD